jgi:hypothetical protein
MLLQQVAKRLVGELLNGFHPVLSQAIQRDKGLGVERDPLSIAIRPPVWFHVSLPPYAASVWRFSCLMKMTSKRRHGCLDHSRSV